MLINKYTILLFWATTLSSLTINVNASESAGNNKELTRSSLVVVTHPGFNLNAKTEFSWTKDHADISGKLKDSDLPVQAILDKAIQQAVLEKGYKFSADSARSLLIHYHVSLESEVDDTSLAIRYGMSPGLRSNSPDSKKYERGTLVVDIIDPEHLKVVWRGAIGVFTGLKDTNEGRQKRVNQLLVELFSNIPDNSVK